MLYKLLYRVKIRWYWAIFRNAISLSFTSVSSIYAAQILWAWMMILACPKTKQGQFDWCYTNLPHKVKVEFDNLLKKANIAETNLIISALYKILQNWGWITSEGAPVWRTKITCNTIKFIYAFIGMISDMVIHAAAMFTSTQHMFLPVISQQPN